ncbi:MAG: energy transducer TonB [Cytophagales bacterium]|nr:MAG: energy transducer TonB [Cytophagales bacterium]TAF59890.1 MAG: energy transducer TonB [Cytophagales bacterium]
MKARNISNSLNDLVFENRNKQYGAYDLRQNYPKRLQHALILASLAFAAVLISLLWLGNEQDFSEPENQAFYIQEIDVPPLINEIAPIIEQSKLPPSQPLKSIQNLPYEPTQDQETVNDAPEQSELSQSQSATHTSESSGAHNEQEVEMTNNHNPEAQRVTELSDDEPDFVVVEVPASFPGGKQALRKFLSKHLKYPIAARTNQVAGKVFVQFTVDKEGIITNVKILKSLGFGCDEEAARVIQLMPKWEPAKQSGKRVKTKHTMTFVFEYSNPN